MTCCEAAYLNNRLTFALMKNTPFPGAGILLPLLVLTSFAQAQSGANSFPSTGNASVGTSASPNNFTVNGTITTNGTISQTGGATTATSGFSTYLLTNSTNNSQSANLMPGLCLYGDRWFDYGLDVGYNGSSTQQWRTRVFCPITADVALSYINETGTIPTSQTQFTDGLIMLGGSGNVLIGKSAQTNSAYKLDVGGNIRGNQVTVNTTGADYVFDPGYRLSPLHDLEDYIIKEHHLPGIKSAARMQQDGLDLGDNQTRLLAKIEELTLYLIEQDKETQALKEKIKTLEERNQTLESLEQRIERLERQTSGSATEQ